MREPKVRAALAAASFLILTSDSNEHGAPEHIKQTHKKRFHLTAHTTVNELTWSDFEWMGLSNLVLSKNKCKLGPASFVGHLVKQIENITLR